MLFFKKDKQELLKRVSELEQNIIWMHDRIKKLEDAAYGLKKDGTPRAKPGRKTP